MSQPESSPVRLALIADIHGNLPALEAVLSDARSHAVRTVWNLGDILGYTPLGDAVIDHLRQHQVVSLLGNYDIKVLKAPVKLSRWQRTKSPEKLAAIRWNSEHLCEAARWYLLSLPETLSMTWQGLRFLLVHGSPVSRKEPLTDETPESRLAELAGQVEADVVLCGHSHVPFVRRAAGCWFVNPGSVGRPEGGDPRACYAIVSVAPDGSLQVEHRRVAYEIERAVTAIREADLPIRFAEVLRRGWSLDVLDEDPDMHAAVVAAAAAWARRLDPEPQHAERVVALALKLADGLGKTLGSWSLQERTCLAAAAWLHDIGWSRGRRRHHKVARDLILQDRELPVSPRQRHLIALTARYHRRGLPRPEHRLYRDLPEEDRDRVCRLASVLRIADALDASHGGVIRDLACELGDEALTLRCRPAGDLAAERAAVAKKADLFERVFGRTVRIESRRR